MLSTCEVETGGAWIDTWLRNLKLRNESYIRDQYEIFLDQPHTDY
jgi:hypothetical protein